MIDTDSIPRHVSESPRINGFRDHGFDNMDGVYDFLKSKAQSAKSFPFIDLSRTDRYFLTTNIKEHPTLERVLNVDVDAGFIDFQDSEHVTLGKITGYLDLNKETIFVTIAYTEYGLATLDVEQVLIDILAVIATVQQDKKEQYSH